MNKIIWTYWNQGLKSAPPVVKPCIEQWRKLNPDWELRFVDANNIHDYIEPLEIPKEKYNKISKAVASDLYKLKLIITHGGVFVDATTFPIIPLNEWLPNVVTEGFFFFHKPGRNRLISIWFVAGEKNNVVLKMHYDNLIKYWCSNSFINNPRAKYMEIIYKITDRNLDFTRLWFTFFYRKILRITPYLITTYSFYNTLKKDKSLMNSFNKMPKISAVKCNSFGRDLYYMPIDENFKNLVDKKNVPILKLNWRYVQENIKEGTNLFYLLNNTAKNLE